MNRCLRASASMLKQLREKSRMSVKIVDVLKLRVVLSKDKPHLGLSRRSILTKMHDGLKRSQPIGDEP